MVRLVMGRLVIILLIASNMFAQKYSISEEDYHLLVSTYYEETMTYKLLETDEELIKVKELCEKHDVSVPNEGICIIAVAVNGDVRGVVNLREILMIEPLVSEHPSITDKLYQRMEGIILAKGAKVVRCFADSENEYLFNKVDFYKVFDGKIVMEKIYRGK